MASFLLGRLVKKIGRFIIDAKSMFTQFLLVGSYAALYTLNYDE